MNLRTLLRDSLAGLAAIAFVALPVAAAPAAPTVPTAKLSPAERGTLESHAAGLIAESIQRRAVRPIAPQVVERDAAQLARTLGDDTLRDLFAVSDASEVIDRALATRTAASPTLGDSYSDLLFVPLT